jgi:hypothetical protein
MNNALKADAVLALFVGVAIALVIVAIGLSIRLTHRPYHSLCGTGGVAKVEPAAHSVYQGGTGTLVICANGETTWP